MRTFIVLIAGSSKQAKRTAKRFGFKVQKVLRTISAADTQGRYGYTWCVVTSPGGWSVNGWHVLKAWQPGALAHVVDTATESIDVALTKGYTLAADHAHWALLQYDHHIEAEQRRVEQAAYKAKLAADLANLNYAINA